jgi:hypothetical protein
MCFCYENGVFTTKKLSEITFCGVNCCIWAWLRLGEYYGFDRMPAGLCHISAAG